MSAFVFPEKLVAEIRVASEHSFLYVFPRHQCGVQGTLWRSLADEQCVTQKRLQSLHTFNPRGKYADSILNPPKTIHPKSYIRNPIPRNQGSELGNFLTFVFKKRGSGRRN